MTRKIYLASSWRNPLQPGFVAALRDAGHAVYDFRNPAPGNTGFSWGSYTTYEAMSNPEGFREALFHPVATDGFNHDLNAMEWADTFVMAQPCGRSAHLELGWATGRGKDCWVLLQPNQEPELMLRVIGGPERFCSSVGELIEKLGAA